MDFYHTTMKDRVGAFSRGGLRQWYGALRQCIGVRNTWKSFPVNVDRGWQEGDGVFGSVRFLPSHGEHMTTEQGTKSSTKVIQERAGAAGKGAQGLRGQPCHSGKPGGVEGQGAQGLKRCNCRGCAVKPLSLPSQITVTSSSRQDKAAAGCCATPKNPQPSFVDFVCVVKTPNVCVPQSANVGGGPGSENFPLRDILVSRGPKCPATKTTRPASPAARVTCREKDEEWISKSAFWSWSDRFLEFRNQTLASVSLSAPLHFSPQQPPSRDSQRVSGCHGVSRGLDNCFGFLPSRFWCGRVPSCLPAPPRKAAAAAARPLRPHPSRCSRGRPPSPTVARSSFPAADAIAVPLPTSFARV
ncbi:MAG: hypothetical protein BJ554DRAFT_6691, partial [Olpidium bornovanus]